MGTVTVRLPMMSKPATGWRHYPAYSLRIDDVIVSRLVPGELTTIDVAPGSHRLAIRSEWPYPGTVGFNIAAGDHLSYTLVRDPTGGAARSPFRLERETTEEARTANPVAVPPELRTRSLTAPQARRMSRVIRWGLPLATADRDLARRLYLAVVLPQWWRVFSILVTALSLVMRTSRAPFPQRLLLLTTISGRRNRCGKTKSLWELASGRPAAMVGTGPSRSRSV